MPNQHFSTETWLRRYMPNSLFTIGDRSHRRNLSNSIGTDNREISGNMAQPDFVQHILVQKSTIGEQNYQRPSIDDYWAKQSEKNRPNNWSSSISCRYSILHIAAQEALAQALSRPKLRTGGVHGELATTPVTGPRLATRVAVWTTAISAVINLQATVRTR